MRETDGCSERNSNTGETVNITRLLLLAAFFVAVSAHGSPPYPPLPPKQFTPEAKVLLAQSCVGEAGWNSYQGECGAIAWIYAKRAKRLNRSLAWVIRHYSAAVKPHKGHKRPWLFELDESLKRPKSWPRDDSGHLAIKWKGRHRELWAKTLHFVDSWTRGMVPDVVPRAVHYGGKMDTQRATSMDCKKLIIPAGFRNFYCSIAKR